MSLPNSSESSQDRSAKLNDHLADMLEYLAPGASKALKAELVPDATTSTLSDADSDRPRSKADPSYRLISYLEVDYVGIKTNMKQFMQRYKTAGGYMPTKEENLYAILDAEGKVRKA